MKIAVISDIHGNSFALDEALKDIKGKKADLIVNLGDTFYGPIDPKGTFDLINSNEIISISGNQDRLILENLNESIQTETLSFVLQNLDKDILEYLKSIPFEINHPTGFYACHASPSRDDEYLLEEIHSNYVGIKTNNQLNEITSSIKDSIIFCGHSHQPTIVKTKNKTIINPGSLGLQAYDDDLPQYHKMETFTQDSKYCLVSIKNKQVEQIEQVSVPYNFEAAAKLAEENNRPDWAKWIRSGRA